MCCLWLNVCLIPKLQKLLSLRREVFVFHVNTIKENESIKVGKHPRCPQSTATLHKVRHGVLINAKYIVIPLTSEVHREQNNQTEKTAYA